MPFAQCLLDADGKPCPYCGTPMHIASKKPQRHPRMPSRDHFTPRAFGGRGDTVIVCKQCNSDKGSWLPHQWLAELKWAGDPRFFTFRAFLAEKAGLSVAHFMERT